MKNSLIITTALLFGLFTLQAQGDSIPLPYQAPDGVNWEGGERNYYSQIWDNQVVTNVSAPSLEVFTPVSGTANGAAVIVAPGGGLYALSIESEGKQVARWLAQRGYTAFVLKYRLVPTGEDGVQEISELGANNPQLLMERVNSVLPSSITDGLNAVAYVRQQASDYGIDPGKIGFMGFSAGGAVTMGVGYEGEGPNAPDFLVPVYPWTDAYPVRPPSNTPEMLIICATDDPLGLAKGSVELYSTWREAGARVALHMYSQGGHGFGMKTQNLPSDDWIHRFHDWSQLHILGEE